MGEKLDIKVYNHSDKNIVFKLINSRCMYIPTTSEIKAGPKEWVVFENVETSHAFTSMCFYLDNIVQIVAEHNGSVLSSSKFNIYTQNSKYYWYATGNPFFGKIPGIAG